MKGKSSTLLIGIAFLSFTVMGLNAGLLGVAWPSIRASFGLSSDILSFLGLVLIGFSGSPLFPVLTSNTPERLGTEHAANAIGFQMTAVRLGLAAVPALVGVLAEAFGLEIVGLCLFSIAVAMFLLHEASVSRKA